MATFSKDYLYALEPCCPWDCVIFEQTGDPWTGAEMKAILQTLGKLDFLPWLMGASVDLATELITVTGESVDLQGIHNRTALHWAITRQDALTVAYLVGEGANKLIADADGYTQTDLAYLSENADIISAMGL